MYVNTRYRLSAHHGQVGSEYTLDLHVRQLVTSVLILCLWRSKIYREIFGGHPNLESLGVVTPNSVPTPLLFLVP